VSVRNIAFSRLHCISITRYLIIRFKDNTYHDTDVVPSTSLSLDDLIECQIAGFHSRRMKNSSHRLIIRSICAHKDIQIIDAIFNLSIECHIRKGCTDCREVYRVLYPYIEL